MPFVSIAAPAVSSAVGAGTTAAALASAVTVIGGVVSAALLVIQHFRSDVHLYADDIVNRLENPLRPKLSAIVDEKDRAIREGFATAELVRQARNGVSRIWTDYVAAARSYGAQGAKYSIVAEQSLANLNSSRGMGGAFPEGFINRLLADMDRQIAALSQKATTAVVGGSPGNWYVVGGVVLVSLLILRALR